MAKGDEHRYPLFLELEGREVVVVGAGPVAERKVEDLLAAGARVRVVAPQASQRIDELARARTIAWRARTFLAADLKDAWLVVSATGNPAVARRVFKEAERRRIFVLAVDDPANGSAISGSVVRRAPFVVVISSSGQAPALTRLLRELVEQVLPDDRWVQAARELRKRWRKEGAPMGSRFSELVRAFKERAK
ncbi:MAG TPA: bifunctional precorrin-2 dehydrogenase/sirohydrochlorin ferrochelatase [Polyangiaceae bacterium]|nr:bifunctional precorrin-2 dehydrogenase/sirohydrochlorin ferrochelatase [Polyangiaceae bacterium]